MDDATQLKHRAYHEAAHAVIAYQLITEFQNRHPEEVVATIEGDGGSVPIITDVDDPDRKRKPDEIKHIQMALSAGEAAELLIFNCVGEKHCRDHQKIERLGRLLKEAGLPHESPDVLMEETKTLLDTEKNRRLVEATAEVLLKHEKLTLRQLKQLIRADDIQ